MNVNRYLQSLANATNSTVVRVRHKKHIVVTFEHAGRMSTVTLSSSTCNQQAIHRQICDIRRGFK